MISDIPLWSWHAAQWEQLTTARANRRLPHALLLTGPRGLGKRDFARRFAAAMVCERPDGGGDACGSCAACRLIGAGTHPDLVWLEPEEPGRPIRIDPVRRLNRRSTLAAQGDGHQVFVVDPADALNPAASNALLKTLEEPVSSAVFVLVSSRQDRLAATLRSRCHSVRFTAPGADEVVRTLEADGRDERTGALVAISGGLPLLALKARAEDWLGLAAETIADLQGLAGRRLNPLGVVEKWEKRPLISLLGILKRVLHDLVSLGSGVDRQRLFHVDHEAELQTLADRLDLPEIFAFSDLLSRLDREMTNNLNATMVLEGIVNGWLRITRQGGH